MKKPSFFQQPEVFKNHQKNRPAPAQRRTTASPMKQQLSPKVEIGNTNRLKSKILPYEEPPRVV